MTPPNAGYGPIATVALASAISRLLVLADPHGAIRETKSVLDREGDERTLACCVGDVVGYADGHASSILAEHFRSLSIPTVQGNHEEWIRPDGSLSIVDRPDAPRALTPTALEWIRSLPHAIEFWRSEPRRRVATMVHSIRAPRWDWIGVNNAPALLRMLGDPSILITGHSHRPKCIVVPRSGPPLARAFDFESESELEIGFPTEGSLVVDAGSLGRADLDPSLLAIPRTERRRRFGTYAIVDFERQVVTLRRVGAAAD